MADFAEVREVIAATLKIPGAEISETSSDKDIPAWDSLGHVNIVMALEQSFDVEFEVEEFEDLKSIPAIIERLNR